MEDKEINLAVAISSRQLMLSERQSKSIIKHAQTSQELQIVKAINSGLEIGKFTAQDDEVFLKFLGEWKLWIGDRRKSSPLDAAADLLMIKNFLFEEFPTITLAEIKLAAKMSIKKELNVSTELYNTQSFSVLYCIGIINAFLEYKKETLAPVFERWNKEPPPEKEWTTQEKLQQTIDMFTDEYEKFRNNGVIEDPFALCFKFLRESKRLVIMPDVVEAAKKYGKEMTDLFLQREDGSTREAIEHLRQKAKRNDIIKIDMLQNRYSRNYCVQEFFRTLTGIEELTGTFKLEEFEAKPEEKPVKEIKNEKK